MEDINYKIPLLGNYSITYFEGQKDPIKIKAGYYGIKGSMTITKGCETIKEAKAVLFSAIIKELEHEVFRLEYKKTRLVNLSLDIYSKEGLESYLTL